MDKNIGNVALWVVAVGDSERLATDLAKKTIDTPIVIEYRDKKRLVSDIDIKDASMNACKEIRNRLASLNVEDLVVHLHFCGPNSMATYLGMLIVMYKIPVVSISSYDRSKNDAFIVTVGGISEEAAEDAAGVTAAF